jgi:hypothetical protein
MDLPSNGPIERNGEWNWFVSGRSSSHFMGEPHPYGAIGLATQRANRAVSISADQWPRRLTTRELTWHGGELQVLWDSTLITHGTPGKVTVSILKEDGTPEKGFAAATVGPSDAEGWRSVEWTRGNRMGNFKGKRIRIEFVFERSRLYADREGLKT